MKLVRFIKSRALWVNVLLILIVCALLFWGLSTWLSSFTRHGEDLPVPDLSRMAYAEAVEELEKLELEYSILDTSEYDPDYPRGSIISQYPEPGSAVKIGREIKLTINRIKPRKIEIPNLIEKTKRRAIYDLESKGFKVASPLKYVPYLGEDVVVKVEVNGKEVQPGERFDKGTAVTLVLGQGLSATKRVVPYLRFLSAREARVKLMDYSLNLGSVIYDKDVEDTSLAKVYRQYPNPSLEPEISMGSDVDIWLTTDYNKIPNDSLAFQRPDNAVIDTTANDTLPN